MPPCRPLHKRAVGNDMVAFIEASAKPGRQYSSVRMAADKGERVAKLLLLAATAVPGFLFKEFGVDFSQQ